MKKLFYFLTALFSLTVIGCVKEDNVSQEQPMVYINVPVSVGENDDSPDTKSLVSIDVEDFQKAAIFAFKASDGTILPNPDGDPLVTTTSEKSFTWSLPANVAMNVYVISNYGDLDLSSYFTNKKLKESDLQALKFTCSNQEQLKALEEKGHGLPMAGVSERVVINAQNNTLNLKVKKLFSRYDIYFDKSAFESKGYTINTLYISASKSNTEVPYFVEGFKQTDLSKLSLVDLGTHDDIINLSYGDKTHAVTLYFLENCQGTKSGASKWYEVANSNMEGLNLCSYIDIGIKATDVDGNDANFFYWVYLGTGSGACVSDFNVKRNEKHTLKLTLKTPDEIPATQGIVFTRKNIISLYEKVRQGTSWNRYADFSLPFETNLSSSETTYEIVGFKNYDTQIGSSVFSNQVIRFNDESDYFETKYPNAGTFGFRVRAAQNQVLNNPITVRIGKKSGDSWVVYDECTVLVQSSSSTYSLEISGETSASVGSTVNLTAKYYTITNGKKDSGVDVTNSASWSVSGVGSVSKGAVTSSTAGTAHVTAIYRGESAYHDVIFTGSTPPPTTVTWRMKSLSITPSSIQVGSSTTSYSAIKEKYVNGVASGETADADVTGWSSSSTSIATVSGGTVTGVAAGTATITATDSSCETGYQTADATITVTTAPVEDVFDHYEYENVNVEIWSTVSNNFPVGGTSYTIKATASATRYEVWTVSGRKAAGETVTATPHISGGGGAFTSIDEDSSSVDCSVGANTGAQRSADYTATATFGEDPYAKSGSASCTVIQEAYVNPDHFEWIDTEISVDAGGTATAQFYSSKALSPTTLYDGGYTDGLSVEYNAPTSTGSTGTRAYKGTATIKAKSTAGGTTQTVTGQTGNSNDQLKVTVKESSVSGYEYSDVNVTISQTGSIARSGSGSVTLSGTATWKYRAVYSNGTYGEWLSGSGTPDIYEKMNGPLNLNGVTVTAPGENTQVEQANASDFRAGISLGGTTYYSSTTKVSQPGYTLSTINITIAGPNEFGYEGEMIFSADKSFPGTVTLGVVYENRGTGSESLVTFTYSQVSGGYGSNYKIDWPKTDGSGPYATISSVYVKKVVVNGAVYNDTPIYYDGDICYMLNTGAPEDEGGE